MFSAEAVWDSIDMLAARKGVPVSVLAKSAGVNPSSINQSRRMKENEEWKRPSLATLERLLEASGTSLTEWACMVSGELAFSVPYVPLSQAGDINHYRMNGGLVGERGKIDVAGGVPWKDAFTLLIDTDELIPVYLADTKLIVAPHEPVRRGDNIFLVTKEGEVKIGYMVHQTAASVEMVQKPTYEQVALKKRDIATFSRAPMQIEP